MNATLAALHCVDINSLAQICHLSTVPGAAILAGVQSRARAGNAADHRAMEASRVYTALAERAWKLAQAE
jgi:hypothetical protein